jgi:hypothetical protein
LLRYAGVFVIDPRRLSTLRALFFVLLMSEEAAKCKMWGELQ